MTQSRPFRDVVQSLLDDGKLFNPRFLHQFSDLEPDDIKLLMDAWPIVSERRKISLLCDLNELLESDTLLSFENLARQLLEDPKAEVRTAAFQLLRDCEDLGLVPIYLDHLKKDPDSLTRSAAAAGLGLFIFKGELEEIPTNVLKNVESGLLEAFVNDTTSLVRRKVLEALGASSRKEVQEMIEAAYHRPEAEWVTSALNAMGRSCDDRWGKHILAHLHDHDENIKLEAIHAAGKLCLKSSRLPLLDMLEDEEDLEIRREIIWTLSEIGGEGVQAKFEELIELEDDDEEVDFLEESLGNLTFNEDLNTINLPDLDFVEEDEE